MAEMTGTIPFPSLTVHVSLITATSHDLVLCCIRGLGLQLELHLTPVEAHDLAAQLSNAASDTQAITETLRV